MAGVFTPYITGAAYFGAKSSWIPDELDQQRILSYQLYEEIYWNVPDVMRVSLRGSNELPIYVPSGRTIVDTTNRYTAPAFGVTTADVETGRPTPASQAALIELAKFMRREKFKSKFNGNKRYGIIRGDSIWHLTADETKLPGSRLSLTALDPAMYFPIVEDDDVDRVVGCHLVESIVTDDGPRIHRVTYRKTETGTVTVEEGWFEVDDWQGPESRPAEIIMPPTELPPSITSLPVYHTKNFEEPGNPFGASELRGLERLMGALNQVMSDEDLTLALEGIGVYATDASEPKDPRTGNVVPWRLGPGRVVHHDGEKFDRITGASNLGQSYGEHYDRLWEALKQSSGTPDIAIGKVNVEIAQSGIALALQLGPMLAKASEKNDLVMDTHNQMFFDILSMWYPAYESMSFDGVAATCVVGDAVPIDREKRFAELNDMLDRGVIDTDYYRVEATKLGYVFPEDIKAKADAEFSNRAAMTDGFPDRAAQEAALTSGATE